MQPWFIPMFYVSGAVLGGLALPRIEQAYLSSYTLYQRLWLLTHMGIPESRRG